jgi:class 3 adenylate cyclase/tetratricopeptide (TPR) repeat protein
VKNCPRCGASNAADARFCSACGQAFAAECPSCGATVGETDRYCPACGTRLGEPERVGEERKLVTVLFADVMGSTALGERLDPERLKDVMSAYFQTMRAEIEAEGGTVEKFIGDAVMAVFGAPIAHEDDAARAVRAALRMQRGLENLNAELQRRHRVTLQVRIGINTGEVLAVEAPVPGEPIVSGDVANVAARLQQDADPGTVVVAERTASAARGFSYRRITRATLRGRSQPVGAFAVESEAPGSERGVPGLRARMVGRDQELALLRSVLDRAAADRRPHLITIYGDPGIGKSRLVTEFVEQIRSDFPGLRALVGRCLPYGEGVTYWPLAEILKSYCGIFDSDPPELALEKVSKVTHDLLTEDLVVDPRRATAALAYTVGLEDPTFDFKSLSPRHVGIETRSAWGAFLTALAVNEPVIVVVEDIHWADDALLDVLEDLARNVAGAVVFLCPARGELGVRRPTWGGGQRNFSAVVLDPLSSRHAELLIDSLLASGDVAGGLRNLILERAEGNPFFLEEIIRKLIDEGTLEQTPLGWRAPDGITEVDIPDTVQATLAARIDLLGLEDKRVLQSAAVVGRVFWTGALMSLLENPDDAIESSLARLGDRDLVLTRLSSTIAGEREYMFKHILTRNVAYESLPRRDRSAAHTRVAHWIERTAGERRPEFVELLAHHYSAAYRSALEQTLEAGQLEQLRRAAVDTMLGASAVARARLATDKAVRLALDALALAANALERSLAHEAAGEGYYVDYRGDRAWESLRAAVDERIRSRPVDDRAVASLCAKAVEIPMRWPGIMMQLPEYGEVIRYLHLGLEHVDQSDGEERVNLLTLLAFRPFAFFYRGSPPEEISESIGAGERAVEMATRLGRADLESAALDALGACYTAQGIYGPLVDLSNRRLALVPKINDPLEVGDAYAVAAGTYLHIGDYRKSLTLAEEGFGLTVADAPSGGLHCLTHAVHARFGLGEWDGALQNLETIVATMGEREMPPMPWMRAWGAGAFIYEARGQPAEADELIDVIARLEGPQTGRAASGASMVALVYARRGDVDGGQKWLDRLTWPEAAPVLAQASCDFMAEAGQWAEAPDAAGSARRVAEYSGCFILRFHADRLEGLAANGRGEPQRAVALLSAAAAGFERVEAEWERAVTELHLAKALVSVDRIDEARGLATTSLALFEKLGSLREERLARALLPEL